MGVVQLQPPAPVTTPRRRRGARPGTLTRYLFVAPAVLYLVAFMIYPLLYTTNLSLFDVTAGNFLRGGASFTGLANYAEYLQSPGFLASLWLTVVFTVGSLVFQHVTGFAFAVFFNRRFPLAGVLQALMLVVWVLPVVVSASLWRWIYSGSYGLLNAVLSLVGVESSQAWLVDPATAMAAVVAANIWVGVPFHMMLLYAGLQGINPNLYEAASLDGAGALQRFWHITVPSMRPVIVTVLLLGFVHTFKVFDLIYVMTAGGPAGATNVLSIDVYRLSFEYFRFGEGAAAANVLLVIPLALSALYLWMRRREESSL